MLPPSCILSKFYIKPQQSGSKSATGSGCILSKFYIKPQLARQWLMVPCVVSYRNSTSNHNQRKCNNKKSKVVSYRNSTSNHNYRGKKRVIVALYLIEILHQTTTRARMAILVDRCILSKFYIKPQQRYRTL